MFVCYSKEGATMSSLLRAFFKKIVHRGVLEVETSSGRCFVVGDGKLPTLKVRFEDRDAERNLLLDPELAFGELYTEGRLTVRNGTIYDVLELVSQNLALSRPSRISKARLHLRRTLAKLKGSNTKAKSKENVAHHYDLDHRFFDLFLDSDRQYSCAYFEHVGQTLEQAQLAKKRHITSKLLLEPGQSVLDVGSGWGDLALYLSEFNSAKVTGITLSEEQLKIARKRSADKNFEAGVKFELKDYRDVSDEFDRIVSIGMFEHVNRPHYDTFFGLMAKHLKPDGIMLLHSIGRIDGPSATNPWIEKYIFPGGYIPALSEVLPSIERAGLIVADLEVLRIHYAMTLRAWRERLVANRTAAVELAGEKFFRMWEFYLAASECGFRFGGLIVFQLQITNRINAVPLTRDYIADRETALRIKDGGRQSAPLAAE
jgi:cyclopropane-fatty-acyl-phospholipid synthase